MSAARGAADAAGADGRAMWSQAQLSRADRHPAAAGDGRAGPQPRAVAVRAAAGGGDRMGDGADRDRAARRPALSAALFGARRAARRDRGGAVGERLGRGAGALRAAAARRTGVRPRPRPLRGDAAPTTIWSRSARKSGRAVSAAEAEPYAGKLLPLPRFRSRGRRGASGTKSAGPRADRPFPDARRAHRPLEAASTEAPVERLVERLRRAGGSSPRWSA